MTVTIIDTDIGTDVDDAMALALAAASPEITLAGVTTVHGNATLRGRIARRLLDLAGRSDVPVVAGRTAALRPSAVEDFHWNALWGHEGAGLLSVAERDVHENDLHNDAAARFLVDKISRSPGEVSLVTIGPLTNVARALEIAPDLAEHVRKITIMGGLVHRGSFKWPAHFETNLNADPRAAEIVLNSGAPITLVPLEVTLQVYLTNSQRDLLGISDNAVARALYSLIQEMREPFLAFNERYGLDGSDFDKRTYMHDPLAFYASLGGSLVQTRPARVQVHYDGPTLRTIEVEGEPNMELCYEANGAAFASWWLDRVTNPGPPHTDLNERPRQH